MKPDEAVAERIHAAEKDVATVRTAVIALNSFVYFVLLDKAHTIAWLAIGALAVAWTYALTVYFLRPYRHHAIMLSSYFTSLTDALLITVWLHATGGFDSPFYVLWYVSIAAVAYRWNGRDTMLTATLYAASYLALVAANGQVSGHWADLTVRIGYIFLVAALGVLLSGEVIDQIRAKVELRKSAARAALAEAKVRGLLDSAPDSIVTADHAGRIVIFNAEAERAFGYSRDEILNEPIETLIPLALRAQHSAGWAKYLEHPAARQTGARRDLRGLRKDGSEFPVDIRFSPATTEEGLLVTAVIRDITDSKQVAEALEESEERFRRLSEVTMEGVVIHENGIILDANEAIAEMLGYRVGEMIGRSVLEFLAPESHAPAIQSGSTLPQTPSLYVGVRRDRTTFPAEVLVREYVFLGRPVRVASVRDVTDRIAAEKALRENEARFRALIENASDFIIVIDRDATIRFVSPSVERMMGYDEHDLVGHNCFEFVHPADASGLTAIFQRRIGEHGVGVPIEFRILRADGQSRTLEVIGNFDLVDSPALSGVILNARDITDRRLAEDAIKQLAYHDALTGLPNRALLEDRLRTALAQRTSDKQLLGIIFLDLDHFKLVNDSLGHVGGDELLKLVSQDLQNLVREGDTVARIGGDEFILLLPNLSRPQEALDVAERILEAFSKRRVILGRELRITTSIGISIYPEDGEDPDSLLANADIAMYQAKDGGRNACQLYSPAMKQDVVLRLALENDLRNAFERNEFVMHCQPIVKVRTGEIVGAEALIRWRHPARGLVSPDDFVPFATDSGLIVDLDDWMLSQACAQAKAWNDAGYENLRMAVNVSARTLQREDLFDRITRVLSTTGLASTNLVLEITEGSAMSNFEPIVISLNRLRDAGVTVSVDDFGTGYSSLSYLKRFPIDSVKIDRSFVRDLTTDSNDAAIVSAIISMAHSLSLRVIAEGVEEPEQLAFLKANGCDEFQGYLFARPLTVADFAQLLASKRKRSEPDAVTNLP